MESTLSPAGGLPLSPGSTVDHERLVSLIASMADGVIAVDDRIRIVLYNGAALNVLDVNSSMKGRPLHNLLHMYDRNGQVIDVRSLILHTKTASSWRDYLLHYDDGSKANLYLSIAPVRFGYGMTGQAGHVLLLRDISREKSLEEERDEFISVVSHELRTPIAIAEGHIGNAQFLASHGQDQSAVNEALQVAHDQVMFLSGLINDLATLSRAERGALELTIEPVDPIQLAHDLANAYTPDAQAKGLVFRLQLPDKIEPVHTSLLYVREILQNFITNAIKYTEKGHVELRVKAAQNAVTFFVADTGIGISKSDRERVYDKFFRSEDFRTRTTSGTGLGLYVTMKLARLLHAELDLQSGLNKGSVFSITVPDIAVQPAKKRTKEL